MRTTMIRRASELDVGSKIVIGNAVRTVSCVRDMHLAYGAFISIVLDNGCAIIERAGALYQCQ